MRGGRRLASWQRTHSFEFTSCCGISCGVFLPHTARTILRETRKPSDHGRRPAWRSLGAEQRSSRSRRTLSSLAIPRSIPRSIPAAKTRANGCRHADRKSGHVRCWNIGPSSNRCVNVSGFSVDKSRARVGEHVTRCFIGRVLSTTGFAGWRRCGGLHNAGVRTVADDCCQLAVQLIDLIFQILQQPFAISFVAR